MITILKSCCAFYFDMQQIIQTIVKETVDYRIIKCFDELGNEWATHITTYNIECKHCDFVQIQNREPNIIPHLKYIHGKEWIE